MGRTNVEDKRDNADAHCTNTVNGKWMMFQWWLHCTVKGKYGTMHTLKTCYMIEKRRIVHCTVTLGSWSYTMGPKCTGKVGP